MRAMRVSYRFFAAVSVLLLIALPASVALRKQSSTIANDRRRTSTTARFSSSQKTASSTITNENDDSSSMSILSSIPRGGFAVAPSPTNVASFLNAMDLLGTVVFAYSGAVTAGKKGMDIMGMSIIATVTAVGGGTLRDCFLGSGTIFWFKDPLYLQIVLATAWLTYFLWPQLEQNMGWTGSETPVCVADAIGLAAFSVVGAQKSQGLGLPPLIWVVTGLMSACFGGVVRDVVLQQKARIMYPQKTLYGFPPMVGTIVYALLSLKTSMQGHMVVCVSFATTLLMRVASFGKTWRLPYWK